MLKELIHLANHLDHKGFKKEADALDLIINKIAGFGFPPSEPGWNPDTGMVEELTGEDIDLNTKRDTLWEEITGLAKEHGISKRELLSLIDEKTTISEEIDALEEAKLGLSAGVGDSDAELGDLISEMKDATRSRWSSR